MTPQPSPANRPIIPPPAPASQFADFTDADLRATMLAATRLLALLAAAAAALFWWKRNWQSAALVLIGAAISAASLWEWLRLMSAINQRMDAATPPTPTSPAIPPRPIGRVLFGFLLRLALTAAALYGSLKFLHGTVFGLAAGLGLGLVSLTVEALRLTRRWTV